MEFGDPEFHASALKAMCRLCGKLAKKRKKICSNYAADILSTYSIHVTVDKSDTHPINFCGLCYDEIRNVKNKKISTETLSKTRITKNEIDIMWIKHSQSGCKICDQFFCLRKGGNPGKRSRKKDISFTDSVDIETSNGDFHNVDITTPKQFDNLMKTPSKQMHSTPKNDSFETPKSSKRNLSSISVQATPTVQDKSLTIPVASRT